MKQDKPTAGAALCVTIVAHAKQSELLDPRHRALLHLIGQCMVAMIDAGAASVAVVDDDMDMIAGAVTPDEEARKKAGDALEVSRAMSQRQSGRLNS